VNICEGRELVWMECAERPATAERLDQKGREAQTGAQRASIADGAFSGKRKNLTGFRLMDVVVGAARCLMEGVVKWS